jgi:membrane-bound lytic murein transglycosylase F
MDTIYRNVMKALLPLSFLLLLIETGCSQKNKSKESTLLNKTEKTVNPSAAKIDLDQIRRRGKLIALTGYSYTSYFIYKGTPMGYEYELLDNLSRQLGVKLEIVVVKNMDEIFKKLNSGEGDIIADNLPVTSEWDQQVDFTTPCSVTRQVLVQRLPEGHKKLSPFEREKLVIRNLLDLAGKRVHVRKETAFYQRLKNLQAEMGAQIEIVEVSGDVETEELLQKVSSGEIEYTVADEQMALFLKSWYPNLDIETPVSFPQNVAWAVRETSPELREAVNTWISKMKKNPLWYAIQSKYFKSRKATDGMVNCSRYSTCGNKISPFDKLIIKEANKIGWDWRLLTSLIYQESRFNPSARSWAGAVGLMQLMPGTASLFGVADPENPQQSITGGVKYLGWLERYWENKVPEKKERMKFILASYNVGQEHVADAQRLTEKYGKNPRIWDDVKEFLILKSKEKYCNDPVVRFGYCRGQEPVHYVESILDRYDHYKKLIKQEIYLASVKK